MKQTEVQIAEDTVSAVITALGEGAVGIIRISGAEALEIGNKLFRAASGKKLSAHDSHMLVYGYIHDLDGSIVDEVLAVYMAAPRSYTAEDVVEIQCHGSVYALQKILSLSYYYGARPAESGEFTKRAFLNGRIDLSQAEAVMDIIRSRSEAGLKLAVLQQQGSLAKKIGSLRKELLDIVVLLEAVIDYPEEDIEDVTYSSVEKCLAASRRGIELLLQNVHTGKILREGLRTAIVGRPNVGKSSLLNALLSEERAIVSKYAGTTRDIIEEQISLGGIPLVLTDTAGIRDTDDHIEKIGVAKSRKALEEAELILCVLDGSDELTEEDLRIFDIIKDRECVIIVNKSDLGTKPDIQVLREQLGSKPMLKVSAKSSAGLDELKAWLQNYVYKETSHVGEGIYVQNARHENLLREALRSLEAASEAASSALPYDCVIIDVRNALGLLGEITGDTVSEDIINEIFSRFCIGK